MSAIIIIDHTFLLRIANYSSSHYPQESITEQCFHDTFGSVMGAHYFSKWEHLYKRDILKMVAYFGRDTDEGQKFTNLLADKVEQYETRIGR